MPLPKPDEGENHDEWIDRCMGDDVMLTEYPDSGQRYVVCQGLWDDKEDKVMKRFWDIKAAVAGVGEVYIYGDIVAEKWFDTDVTAAEFAKQLKELGDVKTLNIYLNSYGGSVFQGQAIYSILKRHQAMKHVHIDGIAASIASVVAMAGDVVHMPANAMMMVHDPWGLAVGNAADLRREADALDKILESMLVAYMAKLKGKTTETTLRQLLADETWMTAAEALAYGFADELVAAKQVAASASPEWRERYLSRYQRMPESLKVVLQGNPEPAQPGPSHQGLADADSFDRRIAVAELEAKRTTQMFRR